MSKIVDIPEEILSLLNDEQNKIRWNILEESKTKGEEFTKRYYEHSRLKYVENYPENSKCVLCGYKFRKQEDPVDHLIPCIELRNKVLGKTYQEKEQHNEFQDFILQENHRNFLQTLDTQKTEENYFTTFLKNNNLDASNVTQIINEDNLKKMFKFYDKDNNGTIDKKEFKKLLSDLMDSLTGKIDEVVSYFSLEMKEKIGPLITLMAAVDGNFEGNPLQEMDTTLKESMKDMKKEFTKTSSLEEKFRELDINSDGVLDFEEFSVAIITFFQMFVEVLQSIKEPFEEMMKQFDFGEISGLMSMMNNEISLPKIDNEAKNFKKGQCTFGETGRNYVYQKYYRCFTCNLGYSSSVCEFCIEACHKGHEIEEVEPGPCFCDCPDNGCCKINKSNDVEEETKVEIKREEEVVSEHIGGNGGGPFEDVNTVEAFIGLRVTKNDQGYVSSIQALFANGNTGVRHGEIGFGERDLVCKEGEKITKVNVFAGAYLDSIEIVTDQGNTYGLNDDDHGGSLHVVDFAGKECIGIRGRSGSWLDGIQFVFKK